MFGKEAFGFGFGFGFGFDQAMPPFVAWIYGSEHWVPQLFHIQTQHIPNA
jgi:hypothetical protein